MILTIYANRESGKALTEHGMHNNLADLLYEMCNDVDASHYKNFSVKITLIVGESRKFHQIYTDGQKKRYMQKVRLITQKEIKLVRAVELFMYISQHV